MMHAWKKFNFHVKIQYKSIDYKKISQKSIYRQKITDISLDNSIDDNWTKFQSIWINFVLVLVSTVFFNTILRKTRLKFQIKFFVYKMIILEFYF